MFIFQLHTMVIFRVAILIIQVLRIYVNGTLIIINQDSGTSGQKLNLFFDYVRKPKQIIFPIEINANPINLSIRPRNIVLKV
jgi:hypothetical protein